MSNDVLYNLHDHMNVYDSIIICLNVPAGFPWKQICTLKLYLRLVAAHEMHQHCSWLVSKHLQHAPWRVHNFESEQNGPIGFCHVPAGYPTPIWEALLWPNMTRRSWDMLGYRRNQEEQTWRTLLLSTHMPPNKHNTPFNSTVQNTRKSWRLGIRAPHLPRTCLSASSEFRGVYL